MENYQGDLTDIVRASGGQIGCNNSASHVNSSPATWQFPNSDDPLTLCSFIDHIDDDNLFGDPFSNIQDPLLNRPSSSNSCYYNPPNISLGYHEDAAPCDSPVMAAASPRGIINAPAASDMINANSSLTSCLVDNTGPGQISSPRNLGIKRRKSLTKKVVCIPAPAAANSRSSGEVVPSDLWAWRKYGQKPIKGSPYPRGYYRCSSSKGCSARKQVERSRTDPNMLVITYTSEHNHPWPTQRNALAGSTRSQPSKANACASASKGSASPTSHRNTANNNIKEEVKDSSNNDDDTMSPSNNIAAPISSNAASCEEENIEEPIGNQMEIADDEFNEGLCSSQIYKPELPDSNQLYHEDFFAELGEIDADPFNIFDWSSDNNNNNNSNSNNTSFGEIKRG